MSNTNTTVTVTSPFFVLGCILTILKAMGYISLSWFWVLFPFILPAVMIIGFLLLVGILVLLK